MAVYMHTDDDDIRATFMTHGSGWLTVSMEQFSMERRGREYLIVALPPHEIVALRDFLNNFSDGSPRE